MICQKSNSKMGFSKEKMLKCGCPNRKFLNAGKVETQTDFFSRLKKSKISRKKKRREPS